MRTWIKSALGQSFERLGGLRRQHAGRIVILTFHRVRPDGEPARRPMRNLEVGVSDFRRILLWMRERYEPLTLADAVLREEVPARASFAVTFDDGWADNYEHAFPVLRELDIPATIFLATGAVDDRTPFWWQHAGLTDTEIEQVKTAPSNRPGSDGTTAEASEDFLTWPQIREMGETGLIRFGPHGHRHELLTSLSRDEALADLRTCQSILQKRIPELCVPVLAWPNGNARENLSAALKAMGLLAAVGTGRGAFAQVDSARWNLPRNNVDRHLASNPGLFPWLLLRAR